MGNAFSPDSPLMELLGKAWNLLVLNLLTLLCCIPVVTAGSAITAAYSVCMQLRTESVSVFPAYFKAFRDNFKQATMIWGFFFLVAQVLAVDYVIILKTQPPAQGVFEGIIYLLALLLLIAAQWAFALQVRFLNKVRLTIRNSFLLGLGYFIRSVVMAVVVCLPVAAFWLLDHAVLFVIIVIYGISGPIYINCLLLEPVFEQFQKQAEENSDE